MQNIKLGEEKKNVNMIVGVVVFLCLLSIQFMLIDTLSFISVPFLLVMVGILVLNVILSNEKIPLLRVYHWLFLSFSIVFLSAFFSVNFSISIQYAVYFTLFGLILILLSFKTEWYIICLKTQLVFSTINAVITILSSFFPYAYLALILPFYSATNKNLIVYWMQNNNYPGLAGQLGTNSFVISLGIAIIIASVFGKGAKNNKIQILLLLIMVYSLFLTGKRGLLIGNIIAILIVWYVGPLSFKRTRLFKVIFALVIMVTSLYFLSLFIPTLGQTFGRFSNNWGDADFSSGRIAIYAKSWNLFKQNPLFGTGINSYTLLSSGGFDTRIGTHNDLLQILVEMGIFGTVIYMVPFLWIFTKTLKIIRNAYRQEFIEKLYNYRTCLLASLYVQVIVLFYSTIGNPLHYFSMLFMYMIFLAIPIGIDLKLKRMEYIR